MIIKRLDKEFAVCKVSDLSLVNLSSEFFFIGKTDEELSLVCEVKDIPTNATEKALNVLREEGYEMH